MSLPLAIVIVALIVLVWVGLRFGPKAATPIAPSDPLWQSAIAQARATQTRMRELHDAGHDVWVKFPLATTSGLTEHVWGRIQEWNGSELSCSIETPPVGQAARSRNGSTLIVAATDIEDWQVQLEDGSIAGGYTTRAQLEIADRDRQPVPAHIRDMVRRMID